MRGHPIIGALLTGTAVGLAYGLYRQATNPFKPGERNYWPWLGGVIAGYFIFR